MQVRELAILQSREETDTFTLHCRDDLKSAVSRGTSCTTTSYSFPTAAGSSHHNPKIHHHTIHITKPRRNHMESLNPSSPKPLVTRPCQKSCHNTTHLLFQFTNPRGSLERVSDEIHVFYYIRPETGRCKAPNPENRAL